DVRGGDGTSSSADAGAGLEAAPSDHVTVHNNGHIGGGDGLADTSVGGDGGFGVWATRLDLEIGADGYVSGGAGGAAGENGDGGDGGAGAAGGTKYAGSLQVDGQVSGGVGGQAGDNGNGGNGGRGFYAGTVGSIDISGTLQGGAGGMAGLGGTGGD